MSELIQTMPTKSSTFTFDQTYELAPPKTKLAYPIPCEDWEYLKSSISTISVNTDKYMFISAVLFGIAGSAIVAALTIPPVCGASKHCIFIAWTISGFTFVLGLLAFFCGRDATKEANTSKGRVINEFDRLNKKYTN